MRSRNTTWNLASSAKITLLCGALLAFVAAPAVIAQSNSQTQPVAQNQTQQNQPATPTNSPAQPNAQPAQPSSPNASPSPADDDQSQPAQQPDQTPPATSAPAPDSQQQADPKTDSDQKLPKTAGDVPLAGLIGLLSFGSALGVHAIRKHV